MIDLSGPWEVEIDGQTGAVSLPGSLDENGIGDPNENQTYLGGLSRKVRHTGLAQYRRQVEIPADWAGQTILLTLERVHWFSELWLNGVRVGDGDSLSVPHVFDLTGQANPGSHLLELCVDNTPKIPIGRIGHALTDWTQTNWNGVIGSMRLEALPEVRITGIHVYTDAATRSARLVVAIDAKDATRETFSISVDGPTPIPPTKLDLNLHPGHNLCEVVLCAKEEFALWSDESPALYTIAAKIGEHQKTIRFGVRNLHVEGKRMILNGHPLFLRGTLECCVFPKTGFPPMDCPSWERIMRRAKEFGLNHLRFHSWCPPEAAFDAADEAGILLQVELPVWPGKWSVSSRPDLIEFMRREAARILAAFGNHPSFALFVLGNELAFFGDEPEVNSLLRELRSIDHRHLVSFSSHGTHLSHSCDFYVQADNGKPGAENRPLRGSTWFGVGSRFDREVPNTLATCDEAANEFTKPVISHEVGEWAVFPDVQNANHYDGVLEARNFRTILAMLRERGMDDQSEAFVQANGKLSTILYKEEIETLLRTKGLSGYQLLGLTDFPGQGTATVGMLDAFWEPKGFVDGAQFREFCAPTVPLLPLEKFVWTAGDTVAGDASVFHSGSDSLSLDISWRLVNAQGRTVREGSLGCHPMTQGEATPCGRLAFSTTDLSTPARYEVVLQAGDKGANRWPIWIFPQELPDIPLDEVFVTPFYREDVRQALMAGKTVWLRHRDQWPGDSVPGRFAPAFWSPIHFKEQVGTMGTLIDRDHPLFADFPTDDHTDWQWWDVLTQSRAMILNALPKPFRPIVQVIDRYERNHKLGTIFEAQVGQGRLLVTLVDFDAEGPAKRQLEHSIRAYLAAGFEPKQALRLSDLDWLYENEP